MVKKIVSGGQTGVDRAALDAAIKSGISYGGWCPKGRIDEFGIIPEKYCDLIEVVGEFKNEKQNYDMRTRLNIKDSDGTLIFIPELPLPDKIKDGTLLTLQEVKSQNKPHLIVDLTESEEKNIQSIIHWIAEHRIKVLNVAGPRESSSPGIYQLSSKILFESLKHLKNDCTFSPKL